MKTITATSEDGSTLYMTLPLALQRPINGGCQCPYCKAHPQLQPMWDTLAVSDNHTWTVHFPDKQHAPLSLR